jgi:TetR/AcrR family transcriptional repressor of nem operon
MSDTREHILSIAFKLFFEKGYKEVTMSELVAASELSKGAFYHYFSSKEELYHQTIEKYFLRFMEDFSFDFDQTQTLRQNLKILFEQYSQISEELKHIMSEGIGISNYLLFLQEALRHDHFKKRVAVYYRMYSSAFENWFDEAKKRGEIKNDLNSKILAKHLTYLMEGQGLFFSLGLDVGPMIPVFNRIIDQFFDQIEINESTRK